VGTIYTLATEQSVKCTCSTEGSAKCIRSTGYAQ